MADCTVKPHCNAIMALYEYNHIFAHAENILLQILNNVAFAVFSHFKLIIS